MPGGVLGVVLESGCGTQSPLRVTSSCYEPLRYIGQTSREVAIFCRRLLFSRSYLSPAISFSLETVDRFAEA